MEGLDTPNVAQMETVARDYSSPVIDWARKAGEYSDESTNGYAFWATLASGTRVLVGRYGAVLREEEQLFPMALVQHATERGYAGMPTVGAVKFDGHDWGASIFDGESLTVDVVSQLAHCHAEWVCVHWRDAGIAGISADFRISELMPMVGLQACGIDRPKPIPCQCRFSLQRDTSGFCGRCGGTMDVELPCSDCGHVLVFPPYHVPADPCCAACVSRRFNADSDRLPIYSTPLPTVDNSDLPADHLMIEYAMMHAPDSDAADRISDLYCRLAEMAL